jgi:hypothetical protein
MWVGVRRPAGSIYVIESYFRFQSFSYTMETII